MQKIVISFLIKKIVIDIFSRIVQPYLVVNHSTPCTTAATPNLPHNYGRIILSLFKSVDFRFESMISPLRAHILCTHLDFCCFLSKCVLGLKTSHACAHISPSWTQTFRSHSNMFCARSDLTCMRSDLTCTRSNLSVLALESVLCALKLFCLHETQHVLSG